MKRKLSVALLAIAVLTVAGCSKKENIFSATVLSVVGEVSLETKGKKAPAQVNDRIAQGSKIFTGERSLADIAIGNHSVRVFENTAMEFTSLLKNLKDDSESTELMVQKGAILTQITKKLQRSDRFTTSTGTIVASVRGTMFLVTDKNIVACLKGTVMVRRKNDDEKKEIAVPEGKMAIIEKDTQIKVVDLDKSILDEIEKGNSLSAGTGDRTSMMDKPEVPLPKEK